MSVRDANVIDGIAIEDNSRLALMISDSDDWDAEFQHLTMLQNKINAYLQFCEDRQYQKYYPGVDFHSAIIVIYFVYEPTETAIKFLSNVQTKLSEEGIFIECHVE